MEKINLQQGGFQEQPGSLITMMSFILRESVFFSREQDNKLYVCFLDRRQSFDRMWHEGIFYKLLEVHIDDTSFLAFKAAHLQIPANVHENFENVFKSKILLS